MCTREVAANAMVPGSRCQEQAQPIRIACKDRYGSTRRQQTIAVGMMYSGLDLGSEYLKHLSRVVADMSDGMLVLELNSLRCVERWQPAVAMAQRTHGSHILIFRDAADFAKVDPHHPGVVLARVQCCKKKAVWQVLPPVMLLCGGFACVGFSPLSNVRHVAADEVSDMTGSGGVLWEFQRAAIERLLPLWVVAENNLHVDCNADGVQSGIAVTKGSVDSPALSCAVLHSRSRAAP